MHVTDCYLARREVGKANIICGENFRKQRMIDDQTKETAGKRKQGLLNAQDAGQVIGQLLAIRPPGRQISFF